MFVIVDIDGTLADIKKRTEIAGDCPDRKDRQAFQKWLDTLQDEKLLIKDAPIDEVIKTVLALKIMKHRMVFLTGRSEKYRNVTQTWLNKYAPDAPLYMRDNNDWRKAAEYKEATIKKLLDHYQVIPGVEKVLAIDDDYDGDCNAMYLRLGIVHLKVYTP